MTVTLSLRIDITYNLNGEDVQDAINRLTTIPDRLAGEGLFTGDGPAEVESWKAHVDREEE